MFPAKEIVKLFIQDRPVIVKNNNDPVRMGELLLDESRELQQALVNLVSGGSIEEVAAECADVYWFLLTISLYLDFDLEEFTKIKASRNVLKRPACNWQQGEYNIKDAQARTIWQSQGGDEAFYRETK